MPETADRDTTADRTEGEPVWVNADGLTVEKVPVSRGAAVVAVHLTLTSNRDDRALVRVVDPLPSELADRVVEFHPAYDPENWSRNDEAVIYEAPMEPAGERTTVYGVEVDGPEQRQLFSTPPQVESAVLGGSASGDPPTESSESTPPTEADGSGTVAVDPGSINTSDANVSSQPFDFESSGASSELPPTGPGEPTGGTPQDVADQGAAQLAQMSVEASADQQSTVDAFVEELERRDLSDDEREVIRDAIEGGSAANSGGELSPHAQLDRFQERLADQAESQESLAESVHRVEAGYDSLRDEVAAAGRQAADVDRLESRLDAMAEQLEEAVETLSDDLNTLREDVEALEDSLEEEVQWRSELRRFLSSGQNE